MLHFKFAPTLCIAIALLLSSCGSSGPTVQKGDQFEVAEVLKEAADIQGSQEYSDGFTVTIPKGAVLEAAFNASSAGYFECRVVKLEGKDDVNYIYRRLVPESVFNREGFETFTITIPSAYVGEKITKLTKK